MQNLFTLFPTPVYKVKLSQHAEFKKNYVSKLTELFKQEPNKKASWAEYCHTWQLDLDDTDYNTDYVHIKDEIDSAISDYCQFLDVPPVDCRMHAWFNVHNSSMYQELHNHIAPVDCPIISGIYYIQFDKTKDNPVLFKNPSDTFTTLMSVAGAPIRNPKLGTDTAYLDNFNIEEGDLILFPSSLNHFVPKAKQPHDQLRISLSFNIFPVRSS